MDLIVIGGGCYGCLHTRQLRKAVDRGKIAPERLVIVDRDPACRARAEFASDPLVEFVTADWRAFLAEHMPMRPGASAAQIVPAPYAPHLLFDWLGDTARATGLDVTADPFDIPLDLPYDHPDPRGYRYISAAGWTCPVTCIEPAICPAIKGPRTWELGDVVRAAVAAADPPFTRAEVFTCRHFAFGVGTIPARALLDARAALLAGAARGEAQRLAVATVSSCHGVVGAMKVGRVGVPA